VHRLARLRPGRVAAIAAAITAVWAAPAAADTTVSLTFDDGNANQLAAQHILADHGMEATFYVITGRVGNPGYFTWDDIASLNGDGNEIGGHTTNHQSLTSLPTDQARAAVCDARQALLARGYPQDSFAYPRGDNNAATEALVDECGYSSGRDVTPISTWDAQGERETIPPANPMALRTPGSVDVNDTLPEIKDWIMDAERVDQTEGDVWIPLVFHHICDPAVTNCADPNGVDGQYMTPSDFDALLDWLQARAGSGTHVNTVGDVMGPGDSPTPADTTVSLTFDDGNANQMAAIPVLEDHGMEGTFYIIPSRIGRPTTYMSWAQVQSIYDAGNEIGGHTMNHAHLTQISEDAARAEICDGRQALLARGYPQASFAYPFGEHDDVTEGLVEECGYLSGRGVAGLQRDPGEADAESIPPADPWVVRTRGSVDVTDTLPEIKDWIMDAEAVAQDSGEPAWIPLVFHHICDPLVTNCADPSGVDNAYITPADFDALLDWLQARAASGTQVETIGEVIRPGTGPPADIIAPTSSIQCDGSACQSGFYNHSVSASLSATDTGGSGVKNIRYTTDGSTPTSSSPIYSGPVNVSATTTIKWRAEDNGGNVEAVRSQTISVDTVRPTSTIRCNGATCSSFYNQTVSVTLSATDAGGSGLKNIRYTTNGSTPTGSSPIYTGPMSVSSTATIRWRAEDNAGNVEAVRSQTISIDKVKPSSVIRCDGGTCSSGTYRRIVSATLSGSDTGGSGLKNIRYTTNGSNPTSSSPVYSASIRVCSTRTIKWRAEDNAGNVESIKSQTIRLDRNRC
jgi:peptidoglycan/xylan/chitin deacetylase (PgdA/CDA1 family)